MSTAAEKEKVPQRLLESRDYIYQQTIAFYLRPVREFLNDAETSEVLINGQDTIYVERNGRLTLQPQIRFESAATLFAAARNIAEYSGKTVDELSHSADARLPDGSRVHIIIPPAAKNGICISIRRHRKAELRLDDLVAKGSITAQAKEFLSLAVQMKKNIVISGGTSSGKTSLLNALSAEIPDYERTIVIEDTHELQLSQPHTVYLEAQRPRLDGLGGVTIRDLFIDSLRMRPDRIIVGEVRHGEALDLLQSMISGHSGALTTLHATSAREAMARLEILCMMNEIEVPPVVAKRIAALAVDIIVQINRLPDGRRCVTSITEVLGLNDSEHFKFAQLFEFRQGTDLAHSGQTSAFKQQLIDSNLASSVILTKNVFDIEQK